MSNYEELKERFKKQNFFDSIGSKNKSAMKSEINLIYALLTLITISLVSSGIKFQNTITHCILMAVIMILLQRLLRSLDKYKRYDDLYETIMNISYISFSYDVLVESKLNNIPSIYAGMRDEFVDKTDLLGYTMDSSEELIGNRNIKSIRLQMFKMKFKNELHRVFDDDIDKMLDFYKKDNIVAVISYFIFTMNEIFLLKIYGKANISILGKFVIIGLSTIAWMVITFIMHKSEKNIKIINAYKNNKKVYDFKYEKTQDEISELEEYKECAINNLNKLDHETFDKAFETVLLRFNDDLNNYKSLVYLNLKGRDYE